MADSIGFGLEGQVTLEDAGTALRAWRELIDAIASDVAPDTSVTWVVESLSAGSLTAEVIAEDADEEVVRLVLDSYERVGLALEHGEPVPFKKAMKPAGRLVGLIDGRIEAIHFDVNQVRHTVGSDTPSAEMHALSSVPSIGRVTGELRTLSSTQGIRVWIYDRHGHRIRCHLTDDQSEEASRLFRKVVTIEGLVRRALADGRPISVTHVRSIQESPEVSASSWRNAVGLLPRSEGDARSEDVVRRMRDDAD